VYSSILSRGIVTGSRAAGSTPADGEGGTPHLPPKRLHACTIILTFPCLESYQHTQYRDIDEERDDSIERLFAGNFFLSASGIGGPDNPNNSQLES
jgi:hypothetical protein